MTSNDSSNGGPATIGPLVAALMANREGLAAYVDRQMPVALRASVDPADVVQDVCCEALRYEADFLVRDPSSGRRWLYTIARNRLTHLLRRHRASRRAGGGTPTTDANDPLLRLLEELAVYERTPSQSAVSHETWAAVQRSMGKLRPEHAAVIRSRYLERLPAAEVGTRTGRTAHAVDQLCSRAMAALRFELRSLVAAHTR